VSEWDGRAAEGKETTSPLFGIQGSSEVEAVMEDSPAVPPARTPGQLSSLDDRDFRQIRHLLDYLHPAVLSLLCPSNWLQIVSIQKRAIFA